LRPLTRQDGIQFVAAASIAITLNVMAVLLLAGELNILSVIAAAIGAVVLSPFVLVLVWPVLALRRVVVGGEFPFLRWPYIFAVLYGLILATLLTFGEFRRFPMLAAAIQALALVTVLSFQGLAGRWGFAETDRRPRGAWARSADIVVAIVVVVAVTAAASSLTWLPLARSLQRDACLDAGGRMSLEGVCDMGR
jgi:hypothetical protein